MKKLEDRIRDLIERDNRNKLIFKLRSEGKTLEEIAQATGVSKQRVHQIIEEDKQRLVKLMACEGE